jgi:copper(I)-binding protein
MNFRSVITSALRPSAFTLTIGLAAALAALSVSAHPSGAHAEAHTPSGRLTVANAWARATPPAAAVAGGFLTVRNDGDSDRLMAAESPVAGRVELHTMSMQDNVMRMRKLESIELPAGERVELRPGAHHLMLMDLQGPLKEGDTFPVRLRFEKAGAVEVQVQVRSFGAQPGSH